MNQHPHALGRHSIILLGDGVREIGQISIGEAHPSSLERSLERSRCAHGRDFVD
jgi:hypothetical protein